MSQQNVYVTNNSLDVNFSSGASVEVVNKPGTSLKLDTFEPINSLVLGKNDVLNNVYLSLNNEQKLKVIDTSGNSALSQIFTEVLDIKNEVLNPTSVQPITGTVFSILQDESNNKITSTANGTKIGEDVNIINNSLNCSVSNITTCDTANTHITNTTFNSNCYGSSDGTTWHHLKTNPTGVLSTNSTIETNNGELTSTLGTGTGTYNALDVQIKNTSIVAISQNANSQSVASSIFVSKPVDMTNPSSFYNVQIGSSVSTNGFLYGAGLVQITGYSASQSWIYPNIYIQQSPDNINWFDSSSSSFNTNGYYNIQIYNAVLYPYLRIYAKFDSISQSDYVSYSANAWIVQK